MTRTRIPIDLVPRGDLKSRIRASVLASSKEAGKYKIVVQIDYQDLMQRAKELGLA